MVTLGQLKSYPSLSLKFSQNSVREGSFLRFIVEYRVSLGENLHHELPAKGENQFRNNPMSSLKLLKCHNMQPVELFVTLCMWFGLLRHIFFGPQVIEHSCPQIP